jgi:hypothetical protein
VGKIAYKEDFPHQMWEVFPSWSAGGTGKISYKEDAMAGNFCYKRATWGKICLQESVQVVTRRNSYLTTGKNAYKESIPGGNLSYKKTSRGKIRL